MTTNFGGSLRRILSIAASICASGTTCALNIIGRLDSHIEEENDKARERKRNDSVAVGSIIKSCND